MYYFRGTTLLLVGCLAIGSVAWAEDFTQEKLSNWHQFRGPDGNGVAANANPPTEFSEDKNLKWKVAIPGRGISSPIVWGDKIFLTTAIKTDRRAEGAAASGGDEAEQGRGQGRRGRRSRPAPTNYYKFDVLCIDRNSGDIVWQTTANEAVPHEAGHSTNTFASGSPSTDGENVYVNFGSFGVYWPGYGGRDQMESRAGQNANASHVW